jgi:hypothetical protein
MEIKVFFYFTEWAKATFWLLAYFSHCWCFSEAAPTTVLVANFQNTYSALPY